uniref:Uncharacterized protein n=1 Tax=viral metagenome TaxID=1070528 RepID=A0A6C0BKI1_9ZZZZ
MVSWRVHDVIMNVLCYPGDENYPNTPEDN